MKYKNIQLKDVADIVMGQSPKSVFYNTNGNGIPFLQGVRTFGENYPQIDTWTTSYNRKAKSGEILFSVRAPVGRVNWANQDLAVGRGLAALKIKSGYSKEYLYYLFKKIGGQLDSLATGTVFTSINKKELEALELKIPVNLSDQEKIADYLQKFDQEIELNNQINDNLLKLAKTKFWQIYLLPTDEFKMVPNGWEIASFSKIMTFSNGHNFKSNEMLKKYEPLTYKVFKQGNILIGGGLNELGTKSWIQKGKVTKLNKYVLKKWDLLMAMTDMKNKVAILGNTALMNCSNQYILNQRVGLIRSNNYNGTSPAYLFLLTNSKPFLHSIRSKAHSGVQVNLSSKEIRDTDVIIAPKNVNDGFNTFVKPIFDRIMVNQLENLTLNELKQTLLNRLF